MNVIDCSNDNGGCGQYSKCTFDSKTETSTCSDPTSTPLSFKDAGGMIFAQSRANERPPRDTQPVPLAGLIPEPDVWTATERLRIATDALHIAQEETGSSAGSVKRLSRHVQVSSAVDSPVFDHSLVSNIALIPTQARDGVTIAAFAVGGDDGGEVDKSLGLDRELTHIVYRERSWEKHHTRLAVSKHADAAAATKAYDQLCSNAVIRALPVPRSALAPGRPLQYVYTLDMRTAFNLFHMHNDNLLPLYQNLILSGGDRVPREHRTLILWTPPETNSHALPAFKELLKALFGRVITGHEFNELAGWAGYPDRPVLCADVLVVGTPCQAWYLPYLDAGFYARSRVNYKFRREIWKYYGFDMTRLKRNAYRMKRFHAKAGAAVAADSGDATALSNRPVISTYKPRVSVIVRQVESRRLLDAEVWERAASKIGGGVIGQLSLYKFTKETTWQDQLKVMSQTDILISTHGAGLSFGLYTRPGSVLLQLLAPGITFAEERLFKHVADYCGLEYIGWRNAIPHLEQTGCYPPNPGARDKCGDWATDVVMTDKEAQETLSDAIGTWHKANS